MHVLFVALHRLLDALFSFSFSLPHVRGRVGVGQGSLSQGVSFAPPFKSSSWFFEMDERVLGERLRALEAARESTPGPGAYPLPVDELGCSRNHVSLGSAGGRSFTFTGCDTGRRDAEWNAPLSVSSAAAAAHVHPLAQVRARRPKRRESGISAVRFVFACSAGRWGRCGGAP
jgi:hypothetical protein